MAAIAAGYVLFGTIWLLGWVVGTAVSLPFVFFMAKIVGSLTQLCDVFESDEGLWISRRGTDILVPWDSIESIATHPLRSFFHVTLHYSTSSAADNKATFLIARDFAPAMSLLKRLQQPL